MFHRLDKRRDDESLRITQLWNISYCPAGKWGVKRNTFSSYYAGGGLSHHKWDRWVLEERMKWTEWRDKCREIEVTLFNLLPPHFMVLALCFSPSWLCNKTVSSRAAVFFFPPTVCWEMMGFNLWKACGYRFELSGANTRGTCICRSEQSSLERLLTDTHKSMLLWDRKSVV